MSIRFGFLLITIFLASTAQAQTVCPDVSLPDVAATYDAASGEWSTRVRTCPRLGNESIVGAVSLDFNAARVVCVPAGNDQTLSIGWTATADGAARAEVWENADCTGRSSGLTHNQATVTLDAPSAPFLLSQP